MKAEAKCTGRGKSLPPSTGLPKRSAPALLCAALAAALALAAGRAGAQDFEGLEILEIEIIATPRLDPARIRQIMRTREGDFYRARALEDDVQRLHAAKDIVEVAIVPSRLGEGVKLTVEAKEPSVVTSVRFEGDLRVREKRLRDLLQVQDGDLIYEGTDLLSSILFPEPSQERFGDHAHPYRLQMDLSALRDFYRSEGFHRATVRQTLTPNPQGVDIVYHIEAGPRHRLESVRFEGNNAFDDRELAKHLAAVRPRTLFRGGAFDADMLQLDLEAVRQFYRGLGWLDATVGHRLAYDDSAQRLFLTVSVREGPRYTVSSLHVRGAALFTLDEIRAAMKLRPGGWYAPDWLEDDRQTLLGLYGEQGHLHAHVSTRVAVDPERHAATVELAIEEGPEVFLRDVVVLGNSRTQDRVIRRELDLHPGERVNTAAKDDAVRRLRNTGLFVPADPAARAEPVRARFQDTDDPRYSNLVFEVEEGRLIDISFGVAFSTHTGLAGQFQLTHNNFDWADTPKSWRDLYALDAFSGGGQELTLSLSPGQYLSDYRLAWFNPALNDSRYHGGFDLYWRDDVFPRYTDTRRGVQLHAGRMLVRDLRASLSLTWEDIEIHDLFEERGRAFLPDILRVRGHNEKRAVGLRLTYDKRDDFHWPTDGYRLDFRAELAGTLLGGDVDVLSEVFDARRYWTLWEQPGRGEHILHVGGRLGFLQSISRRPHVPIFERFFAGGIGTVRGFRYRGLGPTDPRHQRHVGGKLLMAGTAEYFLPVVEDIFHLAAFVDAGKVERSAEDFNLERMRVSTGVGARLRVPMLAAGRVPLIFDLGFPVLKERTDKRDVFSLSMGTGFAF